jgi:hypothetical protein
MLTEDVGSFTRFFEERPLVIEPSQFDRNRVSAANEQLRRTRERMQETRDGFVVVVPSISVPQPYLDVIPGAPDYEARTIPWSSLLSDRYKVIVMSSSPVQSWELQALKMVSNSALSERVQFLPLIGDDRVNMSLARKLLDHFDLLWRVREIVADSPAMLVPYTASGHERFLADVLGIPMVGRDPALAYTCGTKSGARKRFRRLGMPLSPGLEDLFKIDDVVDAIRELWLSAGKSVTVVLKLNDGVSGMGNVNIRLPEPSEIAHYDYRDAILGLLDEAECNGLSKAQFLQLIPAVGAITELYVPDVFSSPSGQFFIHEDGRVEILATHEQILKGSVYLGACCPALPRYHDQIVRQTQEIAADLASDGYVGYGSVDFVAVATASGCGLVPIEINDRQGGTTHLYQTVTRLTGAKYDITSGTLLDENGPLCYRGTDNFKSANFKGIDPEEFVAELESRYAALFFARGKKSGCVMHAVRLLPHGKMGYVAFGRSPEQAADLAKALEAAAVSTAAALVH